MGRQFEIEVFKRGKDLGDGVLGYPEIRREENQKNRKLEVQKREFEEERNKEFEEGEDQKR